MRCIALLLVVLAGLANASPAHGHASLIRSEPADRAVIAQSPRELTLRFNEPVSPLILRLVNPGGDVLELKASMGADGSSLTLAMPSRLSLGTYLLSWRVISADGHPVGGALTFSIGEPTAAPTSPQSYDARLSAAIWLARFALYLGLLIGVGGAFFATWIAASPQPGWPRLVVAGALDLGLLAAVLSVGLHGADVLGLTLADYFDLRVWRSGLVSAYGRTLCIALAALALALAGSRTDRRIARWCSALALAGVGIAFAASGHAATAGPELLTRPAVFLHAVCVTFWLGALLPLFASLASSPDRTALTRFSKAIPWPFLALILSGMLLAILQVQHVEALWTTNYGIILSCKLGAVCVLLALAGINRRLTPRVVLDDAGAARQLLQSITIELAIAVLILGLVASWRFTPPPRALSPVVSQPIRAHIHRDVAMADVQMDPVTATGRRVTLSLLSRKFEPLGAKEVTLVLSKPDAGIEALRLAAEPVDEIVWQVEGVRLPVAGRWRARIEILINDFEKIAIEDDIEVPR